jgi:predicted metal-binding protein
MSNPTLFVCQSCNDAAHKRMKPSQGAQLLEQLNTLQSEKYPVTIQPVDCLWK